MKTINRLPYSPYHLISIFLLAVFAAAPCYAATVVASYNFTSGSAASSDSDGDTTASDITFGSGISGEAFANNRLEIGGDDTLTTESGTNIAAQLGTAISANGYATFTFTIPDTVTVNMTSLQFDYGTDNAFRFGIGAFSDKTGFTLSDQFYDRYVSTGNTSFPAESNNLSGITELQNLTDTTVEFRFYIGDGSSSDTRTHFFDNISLSGNVSAVPESSAFALLGGMFALTWAMLRRRM